MPKKLPSEMTNSISSMYVDEGKPAPQIAEEFGIGITSVYRYLKRSEIEPSSYGRMGHGYRSYRFTDEDEQRIRGEYESGKSFTCLAEKYNSNRGTIRNVIRRGGGNIRHRGGTPEPLTKTQGEQIVTLHSEGFSQESISRKVKISAHRVRRHLNSLGIISEHRYDQGGHWKGGRTLDSHGYVLIRLPIEHPFHMMTGFHGYVAEHRLVMAEAIGRPLHKWETVHHIDGNRQNNSTANLQLRIGKHGNNVAYRCSDCGSTRIEPYQIA